MSSRKHKQRERFLTHQGGTPLMPRKGKERCYKKVKLKTNKPQRKPSILSDEIQKHTQEFYWEKEEMELFADMTQLLIQQQYWNTVA